MGWRFRKSFKILPGVRMNVGKRGISSFTFGPRGASISKGKNGTYANLGLKGTGLSYRTKLSNAKPSQQKQKNGCLPIALFFLFMLIMLKSCFTGNNNSKADVKLTANPPAQKLEQKAADEFKPIPYLEERKPIETPDVSEFEEQIAQKHKESELQRSAEDTREKIRQWRQDDEQIRSLLSNNSGSSSSSYYSPPSNYGSQYESSSDKSVSVRGYYRKDGTYVQPHKRSRPNR